MDASELDGLVDAAYRRFGKVDVLVNNAGMSPLYGELVDVPEALYDKVAISKARSTSAVAPGDRHPVTVSQHEVRALAPNREPSNAELLAHALVPAGSSHLRCCPRAPGPPGSRAHW
jgi:NAD(P)-dependent dehydrogenase (short-subunit alcohol dehydrogenase family)